MRVKNAIRFVLFLVLSLPAFALQPEHDKSITFFRDTFHTNGPQAALQPERPATGKRMNEELIQLLFSAFTAFMVVGAIRGQQRQDFTQFRQGSSPS
ncbi:hypothetical protein FJ444_09970 [Aestuariibacter sp. GS-14]|uniref:hypothetical protein n=1 Tax=Aestuariibacter sp. GS-14 TaxID=2590670 RepID=UPI00112C4831|nr:hypothetical protein [Aestuariibacter sp. GS-14]TPV58359.1 hypothetical protein FJ444_09970 [Aestuariibacter sp. GS-14]